MYFLCVLIIFLFYGNLYNFGGITQDSFELYTKLIHKLDTVENLGQVHFWLKPDLISQPGVGSENELDEYVKSQCL